MNRRLAGFARWAGSAAPRAILPVTTAINNLVIEGDSITSTSPSTYSSSFYSYRYQDLRTDKTITVRAQASRAIGTVLNDDSNRLMGNVAEDMAYNPDLLTVMIGANDLAGGSDAALYRSQAQTYYNAVKAERPGCLVAWSGPTPYRADPVGSRHPNYDTYTARRASLMGTIRDPAVWGLFADFYIPMGEHPDFVSDQTLFGDSVHPTGFDSSPAENGGQNRLYDVYVAAVNSIMDASVATSQTPYNSVWPADEIDLMSGTTIVRRFILSGLAHAGVVGDVSVANLAGAGVRINSTGAYASTAGMTHLYNGDVVEMAVPLSSAFETAVTLDLTIGAETRTISYTTAENVAPVAYVVGGKDETFQGPSTTTTATKTFAAGKPIIATYNIAEAASVTVGGQACVRRLRESRAATRGMELWEGPEMAAGAHEIVITYVASATHRFFTYGAIQNAAFVSEDSLVTGFISTPHITPNWGATPTNGLAICLLGNEDNVASVTGNGGMVIDPQHEGTTEYQTSHYGLAVGTQTADGPGSFQTDFGRRYTGYVLYQTS